MDTIRMIPNIIISAKDISIVNESNREILHNVSFAIPQNAIFGLFGESGAGKTLAGRAMAAQLPWGLKVSTGEFEIKPEARPITMVPQMTQAALPPLMSVYNLIATVLRWNGLTENTENVKNILNQVGFLPELNASLLCPHQLSGGLALRAAIAAALATSPRTLILDEPTSNLDPISAHSLSETINKLNIEQKQTIIIITHDVHWARNLCTHFLVIKEGRSLYNGSMEALGKIEDEYIKNFFARI